MGNERLTNHFIRLELYIVRPTLLIFVLWLTTLLPITEYWLSQGRQAFESRRWRVYWTRRRPSRPVNGRYNQSLRTIFIAVAFRQRERSAKILRALAQPHAYLICPNLGPSRSNVKRPLNLDRRLHCHDSEILSKCPKPQNRGPDV